MASSAHTLSVIGFTGKIGVGKSTLSNFICTILNANGFKTRMVSFGDPLRFAMFEELGIPLSVLYTGKCKEEKLNVCLLDFELKSILDRINAIPAMSGKITEESTLREVFQIYSQDYRRVEDPEVWLNQIDGFATVAENEGVDFLIIDDIRQENELDWCSENGVVFRVLPYEGYTEIDAMKHSVEAGFAMDDHRISDDLHIKHKGIEHLRAMAESVASSILFYRKNDQFAHVRFVLDKD